jgi:hypothetical protein
VSNAVPRGRQFLRACIVNFRTRTDDVDALLGIVILAGRRLDAAVRPPQLMTHV